MLIWKIICLFIAIWFTIIHGAKIYQNERTSAISLVVW